MYEKYRLLSGLIVSALGGITLDIATSEHATLPVAGLAWFAIAIGPLLLYPEKVSFSKRTILLAVTGCALGILYYLTHYLYGNLTVQMTDGYDQRLQIYGGLLISSVAIPLYEEKAVRSLIYLGLCRYARPILSNVLVSLLFGLVHRDVLTTSALSVFLCLLTTRGVGVYDRAVFHGMYNFTLIATIFSRAELV